MKGRIELSRNIEIEFKNILTKSEFTMLKTYFHLNDDNFIKQENHYFDTPQFSLKDQSSALRIREKNGSFEMTLKQPVKNGLLETNQLLTSQQASNMIETGKLISGIVMEAIINMNINPNELQYFGTLTTERAEIPYKNGLIVLDFSYYLNTFDYEIEYEVNDYETGKQLFEDLLQKQNIPQRKTTNKIKRFYLQKQKLSQSINDKENNDER